MTKKGKKNKVVPKKQEELSKIEQLEAEKKKLEDPSNIFPSSLSIFNDLSPYGLYSRHYYAIRYILKPTIFSASVTLLYSVPWITLLLMLTGFIIDLVLGQKGYIFKTKLNNDSIMIENGVFVLISVLFAIFVAKGEDEENAKQTGLGYGVIGLIAVAFISLIFFKVKGKKAL
jgi:hypothetical protein